MRSSRMPWAVLRTAIKPLEAPWSRLLLLISSSISLWRWKRPNHLSTSGRAFTRFMMHRIGVCQLIGRLGLRRFLTREYMFRRTARRGLQTRILSFCLFLFSQHARLAFLGATPALSAVPFFILALLCSLVGAERNGITDNSFDTLWQIMPCAETKKRNRGENQQGTGAHGFILSFWLYCLGLLLLFFHSFCLRLRHMEQSACISPSRSLCCRTGCRLTVGRLCSLEVT